MRFGFERDGGEGSMGRERECGCQGWRKERWGGWKWDGKLGRAYRVPIRMSDWILTTPFSWTRVWAWPIRRMTASQGPSVSGCQLCFFLRAFHVLWGYGPL